MIISYARVCQVVGKRQSPLFTRVAIGEILLRSRIVTLSMNVSTVCSTTYHFLCNNLMLRENKSMYSVRVMCLVCVYIYAYGMCVYVCVSVCVSETWLDAESLLLFASVFEQGSSELTELGFGWSMNCWDAPVFLSSLLGLQVQATTLRFQLRSMSLHRKHLTDWEFPQHF